MRMQVLVSHDPHLAYVRKEDRKLASFLLAYVFSRVMDNDYILSTTRMYGEELVTDVMEYPSVRAVMQATNVAASDELIDTLAKMVDYHAPRLRITAQSLPINLRHVSSVIFGDGHTCLLELAPNVLRAYCDSDYR